MKLLKCPKCGELFSDSYKECPFCAEDEELAQGGKARHGRRIQRQKSPSIGGPVLVIVIVFLAAFLVYAFFGDKISSLFEKTDKPSVEDVTPAPSPTPDTSVTLTLDQQTLTLVEGGSTKLTVRATGSKALNNAVTNIYLIIQITPLPPSLTTAP